MVYEFRPVASCNMCGRSDFKLLGLRLSGSQGIDPRRAPPVKITALSTGRRDAEVDQIPVGVQDGQNPGTTARNG